MPSGEPYQADTSQAGEQAIETPLADPASCTPVGNGIDPADWKWPADTSQFPAGAPLQALMLSATKLLGAYGQSCVQAAGLKVSLAGLGVLRVLLSADGLRASEVADRAWSSPGTLTSVVNTLVRDGFAERRPDSDDRRVVRLYITDSGRALVRYYVSQAAPRMRKAFDFVDESDEAVVRRFFAQMIDHLSQLIREERGSDDRNRAGRHGRAADGDVGDQDPGAAQDI